MKQTGFKHDLLQTMYWKKKNNELIHFYCCLGAAKLINFPSFKLITN